MTKFIPLWVVAWLICPVAWADSSFVTRPNIGGTNLPFTYTNAASGSITHLEQYIIVGTVCDNINNFTPYANGGYFVSTAGTHQLFLKGNGGHAAFSGACLVSGDVLSVNFGPIAGTNTSSNGPCTATSGCVTYTCSAAGTIGSVGTSTLTLTCP